MTGKPRWKELTALAKQGKFNGGMGYTNEGSEGGEFAGPISEFRPGWKNLTLSVSPCAHRMAGPWKVSKEGRTLASFSYDDVAGPTINSDGSVRIYVQGIGSIAVYPKDHVQARNLRLAIEAAGRSEEVEAGAAEEPHPRTARSMQLL